MREGKFKPTINDARLHGTYVRDTTRTDQPGEPWNGDKQLHETVGWIAAHRYEDLRSKVAGAIESMEAMA